MRRLAAALLTTTVLLAGCAGGDEPDDAAASPEPTATDAASPEDLATLQAVTVEGDPGSEPTLTFDQPFEVSGAVAVVETPGEGDALEEGQILTVHYVALAGDDGTVLGSTWEQESPEELTLGDPQILPALNDALAGQNVGARVLFASPGGEATEESEGFPATVMAIDVISAEDAPEVLDRAEGEAVEPAEGLPTVTLADDGAPTVEVPEGYEAPSELVVQPLIEGEGPEVESGDSITVHYHGTLLDGTVFDSSWERGSPAEFGIGTGQVIPGWDQAIVGQKVGSQLLLVIPPDLAYGDREQGEIPANSPLVFVVDILSAR